MGSVIELLRSNDAVYLSYVCALLADAGIEPFIFDAHISAAEGFIGAFPRRLMVAEDDLPAAQRILDEAIPANG